MAIGIFRRRNPYQVNSENCSLSFRNVRGVVVRSNPKVLVAHTSQQHEQAHDVGTSWFFSTSFIRQQNKRTSRRTHLWRSITSTIEEYHNETESSMTDNSTIERPPDIGIYSSNHVLINQERYRRGLPPLHRSKDLDELAQWHANKMAENEQLMHSCQTIEHLQILLNSELVGENIQSGLSVLGMHEEAVRCNDSNLWNMLNQDYMEVGLAITRSSISNQLFCCQFFRG